MKNLTGQRFTWLVVLNELPRRNGRQRIWLCQCDCGALVEVYQRNLTRGASGSCGCLRRAISIRKATTHGLSRTPMHTIWCSMIQRCTNPKFRNYHRYGGRGIRVCHRWLDSFEAFLEDMGQRPSPGHSIERKNNDGDYEPGNCIWATAAVQRRNASNVRLLTFRGETLCLTDWATKLAIPKLTLWQRLYRSGWSTEKALTTPTRKLAGMAAE